MYNETVGAIKETYGQAVGSSSIEQAGRDQAAQGEVENTAVQAKAYADATAERVGGKLERLGGALSGDVEQQKAGEVKEAAGKAAQRESPSGLVFDLELTLLPAEANA